MLKDELALYSKLTGKDGLNVPVGIIGAYLDGYERGKADAQPEPNWVPCSERLPEEQWLYLVTELEFERIEIDIRYFNIDGDNKFWSGWGDDPVLAWMPLPAQYTEDAQ